MSVRLRSVFKKLTFLEAIFSRAAFKKGNIKEKQKTNNNALCWIYDKNS